MRARGPRLWRPIILATLAIAASVSCIPLTSTGLRDLAKVRDETTLVFFASWCSDCKRSLLQPRPAGSVAIATFDEKDAAEAVIATLGVQLPCYLDDGIAAVYGVKSVPATKVVDRMGRVK